MDQFISVAAGWRFLPFYESKFTCDLFDNSADGYHHGYRDWSLPGTEGDGSSPEGLGCGYDSVYPDYGYLRFYGESYEVLAEGSGGKLYNGSR